MVETSLENRSDKNVSQVNEEQTAKAVAEERCESIDGINIETYSKRHGISKSEVWKRLRSGELVGRTENGELRIYSDLRAAPSFEHVEEVIDEPKVFSGLPPLPSSQKLSGTSEVPITATLITQDHSEEMQNDMALFFDHLSIAKEENREIIRLTQNSLQKVTDLSEQLLDMKDAVIAAKEAQIKALKEQLEQADQQNARLRQENEDLQMLMHAMDRD